MGCVGYSEKEYLYYDLNTGVLTYEVRFLAVILSHPFKTVTFLL